MGWNWRKAFNFWPAESKSLEKGRRVFARRSRVQNRSRCEGQDYSQTSIPGTGIYKRRHSGQSSGINNWSLAALIAVLLGLLLIKFLLR